MSGRARLPWLSVFALCVVVTIGCGGSMPLLSAPNAAGPTATVSVGITPTAAPAPQLTAGVPPVQPTPTNGSAPAAASSQPQAPSPTLAPAASPRPAASPTPAPLVLVVATNAGGGGAGLYPTTTLDNPIQRLPIATQVTVVGADRQAGGKTWKNVKAPDGTVGWMPAEYLVALPGTGGTPPASSSGASAGQTEVKFVSVVGASPGGTAQVTVQAMPGAACAVEFVGADGSKSDSAELLPRVARENGQVSWSWSVSPEARTGNASVTVMCDGVRATATIAIGVQLPAATPGAPTPTATPGSQQATPAPKR